MLTLSSEMGLAIVVTFKENIDKIENATAKIYAFVDEVIERRLIEPGDDIYPCWPRPLLVVIV